MRFARFGLCMIACASATVAQAQSWVQIGSSDTDKLSIDPTNIKRVSGSIRSAWFQFDKKAAVGGVTSTKEFDRVDCENESIATVSVLSYRASGSVVRSHTTPIIILEYEPAPPGTFAATMLRVVCNFDLSAQ